MSKDPLDVIEIEIYKCERALLNLETELLNEYPSYARLKKLADEVIKSSKRLRKAIRRDKPYFT